MLRILMFGLFSSMIAGENVDACKKSVCIPKCCGADEIFENGNCSSNVTSPVDMDQVLKFGFTYSVLDELLNYCDNKGGVFVSLSFNPTPSGEIELNSETRVQQHEYCVEYQDTSTELEAFVCSIEDIINGQFQKYGKFHVFHVDTQNYAI